MRVIFFILRKSHFQVYVQILCDISSEVDFSFYFSLVGDSVLGLTAVRIHDTTFILRHLSNFFSFLMRLVSFRDSTVSTSATQVSAHLPLGPTT